MRNPKTVIAWPARRTQKQICRLRQGMPSKQQQNKKQEQHKGVICFHLDLFIHNAWSKDLSYSITTKLCGLVTQEADSLVPALHSRSLISPPLPVLYSSTIPSGPLWRSSEQIAQQGINPFHLLTIVVGQFVRPSFPLWPACGLSEAFLWPVCERGAGCEG